MIVAIDGKPVARSTRSATAIAAHKPGDKVELSVVHADGSKSKVEVKLGRVPDTATP